MSIAFDYDVISTDESAGVMEVLYTHAVYGDVLVGVRLPLVGESREAVIIQAAPTAIWEPRVIAYDVPPVGLKGSIGSGPVDVRTPLQVAKDNKLAEIALWRYVSETGGVMVGGSKIRTDRESQAQVTGAFTCLSQGLVQSIDWKASDGSWVTLGLPQVTAIATAVSQHVQSCFTAERELAALVAAALTVEDVQAISTPVEVL